MESFPRKVRAITSVPVPLLYSNFQVSSQSIQTPVPPPPPSNAVVAADTPEPSSNAELNAELKIKRNKLPARMKRAKRNKLLSRIIYPKSALQLLHELRNDAIIRTTPTVDDSAEVFICSAEVVIDGHVVATGQGHSKNAAKQQASEAALKAIVKKALSLPSSSTQNKEITENKVEAMETDEQTTADSQHEEFPWASLASFALHRLFADWNHTDGLILPPPSLKSDLSKEAVDETIHKDIVLPENASFKHPASLLNELHPGIKAIELQRTMTPNCSVTVGYKINDQLFSGTAHNFKKARLIAATKACSALYGINFIHPSTKEANELPV